MQNKLKSMQKSTSLSSFEEIRMLDVKLNEIKAEQRKPIKEFELLSGKDVFIKVIEALRQNIIRGPLR